MTHPLLYVCAFCGDIVGTHPDVRSTVPAVLTFCDKPGCREEASKQYKRSAA